MFCRAVVAILAVAVGILVLTQFAGRPDAAAEDEGRTLIELSEVEVAFIRREMRGLLESVQDILDAAAAEDRERLVAAARRAGMNGPEKDHIPVTLSLKLPMKFKKLGLGTHRAFDGIAAEAPERNLAAFVAKRLSETMTNCTACHATYGITAASGK